MTDTQPEEFAALTDEELAQPGVLEALVAEIKDRAALSIQYKQEMEEAKTDVKRKHFEKKLVRNNEQSVDLIVALERIAAAREQNGTNTDVEGNAETASPTEESSE